MNSKLRVAVLFGGKSAEHEISLISGMNIIAAIDREAYEPVLIGVDKSGKWFLQSEAQYMQSAPDPLTIRLTDFGQPLAVIPGDSGPQLLNMKTMQPLPPLDAIFPILHGPLGEDGSTQGLLRLLNLPYVGPDVLGSAVAMDKDVAKRLLTAAGIPNAPFRVLHKHEIAKIDAAELIRELGLPLFIKPANMGSSVGISKAKSAEELLSGITKAFNFDTKVIVEEFVKGRELECAVLGNETPRSSVPGEIIPKMEFYSYEAKYVDESGAGLEAPARNLTPEKVAEMQALAVRTFRVLGCEGMSRVDFFMKENGQLYVNEVNTLPGFTKISMYPRLWGLTGIPYKELIHQLIQLAVARHERSAALSSSVN